MGLISGEGEDRKKAGTTTARQPVVLESPPEQPSNTAESDREAPASHAQGRAEREKAPHHVGQTDVSQVMARFREARETSRKQTPAEQTINAIVDAAGEGSLVHDLAQLTEHKDAGRDPGASSTSSSDGSQ